MQRVIYLRRLRTDRDQHGLQQQLERAFQRQWGQPKSVIVIAQNQEIWRPPADVYETDASYVVRVEVPGMRDAEIEITLDERTLRIAGNRPEQRDPRLQCYHQMGVNYGSFELEVFLAQPVDYDNVTAHYDDGFLTIDLPKPNRNSGPRIVVQVGDR